MHPCAYGGMVRYDKTTQCSVGNVFSPISAVCTAKRQQIYFILPFVLASTLRCVEFLFFIQCLLLEFGPRDDILTLASEGTYGHIIHIRSFESTIFP